jgi:uncharacterized protein with HEPN domain
MRPDSAAILWDVHAAATRVAEFIVGLDEASYATDFLRRSAVERQLEIVGEALNNLRKSDPDTAQRTPEISRIIGLRNILAHWQRLRRCQKFACAGCRGERALQAEEMLR